MDCNKTANEICGAVGGSENIISASHCATRLRLITADRTKYDKSQLENIDGVKGVFEAAGQLQLVIEARAVNKLYAEFIKTAEISGNQGFDGAVASPMEGVIIPLEEVNDAAFAGGFLGMGAAVLPTGNTVTAPMDGTVSTVSEEKHAIGLELNNGMELLIHIGINTVSLKGEGFTVHVSGGDTVERGQKLITFDSELIKSKGYETTTPIIIINSYNYENVSVTSAISVKQGEELINVIKG